MVALKTLKQYIQECEDVLASNDRDKAHELVRRIESVFSSEIEGIGYGLDIHSAIKALPGNTSSIDYVHDVKLLREKLQLELDKMVPEKITEDKKLPKIFISHNSKDKAYVKLLVKLFEGIGLTEDQVFCSSVDGYGVPLDENIYDFLRKQFEEYDLHVVFILSKHYYQSAASLNEMGAAWVTKTKYTNILLPGFDYDSIVGVIDKNHSGPKLDAENSKELLTELKNNLIDEFGLHTIPELRWEKKRDTFLNEVMKIYNTSQAKFENSAAGKAGGNSFPKPVDALFTGMNLSHEAMILLAYASKDPNGQIMHIRSLSGTSIAAGKWDFISEPGNPRDVAIWEDALEELINYGFVKASGTKHQVFSVTRKGYDVADAVIENNNIDVDENPDKYLEE